MEALITYRLIAEKLHESEKKQLINKVIEIFDCDHIISCIFDKYVKLFESKEYAKGDRINEIVSIIKDIIHNRKKINSDPNAKANKSNDQMIIKLDNMPSILISIPTNSVEL